MKIQIVIDTWKAPIYIQRLKDEGFGSTATRGETEGTTWLLVNANSRMVINDILHAAEKAAQHWAKQNPTAKAAHELH